MLIAFGISNQQDSGLLELLRDLIGESSGSPSGRCASSASSVLSEFIDCSLTVFFGADDDDFAEVGNRSNDSGCEFDAVVGLIDFEDGNALLGDAVDEPLHLDVVLPAPNMGVRLNQSEDVLLSLG